MDCVKCQGELKKVTIDEVEVDQCAECSGTWFDFGELKKVLQAEDVQKLENVLENNEGDDLERGKCPSCGGDGNMVQCASLKAKDIHIDVCPICYGRWLDGGELERLRSTGVFKSVENFFKGLA
jgi:Zn-finger nucleic acid-binding protein